MASVHATAPRSVAIARSATADAVWDGWQTNIEELRKLLPRAADTSDLDHIEELARRYIDGRHALFEHRVDNDCVVAGHGDLEVADIFILADGPRILDAIEFDDRLRHLDVLADVAFLAMDLERLGRGDLAARFLSAYRELSGATWPRSLEHHYVAQRALIRAKVNLLRQRQGRRGAGADAARLLAMARSHLEAARVRLIAIGGLPGTGKSTLASRLGDELSVTVLRSDELRKELVPIGAANGSGRPFGQGLYDRPHTDATYRQLLVEAGALLRAGESVILDASWSDVAHRRDARVLATATTTDLFELRCVAPDSVAARRITARSAVGTHASDATVEIAARMAEVTDPWPSATVIPCGGPVSLSLALALAEVSH
jgi:predicted kinase